MMTHQCATLCLRTATGSMQRSMPMWADASCFPKLSAEEGRCTEADAVQCGTDAHATCPTSCHDDATHTASWTATPTWATSWIATTEQTLLWWSMQPTSANYRVWTSDGPLDCKLHFVESHSDLIWRQLRLACGLLADYDAADVTTDLKDNVQYHQGLQSSPKRLPIPNR